MATIERGFIMACVGNPYQATYSTLHSQSDRTSSFLCSRENTFQITIRKHIVDWVSWKVMGWIKNEQNLWALK